MRVWLLLLAACSSQQDAQSFAADWLRDLASGRADSAYKLLCSDAQAQLSSLAQRSTGESPQQFLGRLAGRYGGVDAIEERARDERGVDLDIITKEARLPLRIERQKSGFCITLP
jgi:hypothetical protein